MTSCSESQVPHQMACHHCDQLLEQPRLAIGEQASCPRCGGLLMRHHVDAYARASAFAVAAIVLLICALQFPFLGFSASGQEQSMSLLQSGTALVNQGEHLLGALILTLIVAGPLLTLVVLTILLVAIMLRVQHSKLPMLGKLFIGINRWNMVEVFIIGVLVSLTKIAAMAHIVLGVAFFAFIGFGICLILACSSLDRHDLWRSIEELTP